MTGVVIGMSLVGLSPASAFAIITILVILPVVVVVVVIAAGIGGRLGTETARGVEQLTKKSEAQDASKGKTNGGKA
jgi:hypothetical protein